MFIMMEESNLKTFEIYFNDLNEKTQKNLLVFVGAEEPKEMNWDLNIVPIATFDYEEQE